MGVTFTARPYVKRGKFCGNFAISKRSVTLSVFTLSVCLSVCPSITLVNCIETAKHLKLFRYAIAPSITSFYFAPIHILAKFRVGQQRLTLH